MYFFTVIQCTLFLFMALHDWIDIPPLTNLAALKKARPFKLRLIGSIVSSTLVLIPLVVTFFYLGSHPPLWARLLFAAIYGFITFGTITAWWIPYFGGRYWMPGNKAGSEEYRDTHSFLPRRGNNVVPNTLHIILHIQIWACFGISLYWLFT